MINEIMEKRVQKGRAAYLTAIEIETQLKKLAQGVAFFLEKNTDEGLYASTMFEQLTGKVNTVYGHSIYMPFVKHGGANILRKKDCYLLPHELRHFFDKLANPKMAARENSFERLKHKDLHWKFYRNEIYPTAKIGTDKNTVMPKIKAQIEEHFDRYKTSKADKVEILQYWRYQLKTELNAAQDEVFFPLQEKYKNCKNEIKSGKEIIRHIVGTDVRYNSADFPTRKEKLKALSAYKKEDYAFQFAQQYGENFFYEEKLKLVEDLLAQALSTARTRHKSVLDVKHKGSH